jgi:signal transduction histidine kinase
LRAVIQREGIGALAFVPITFDKRLLGKFMVYYNAPHTFAEADVRHVQTIASQVAFAIQRQNTEQSLERLVEERTTSLREAIVQMEEFSYSVSHDLRGPVRAMKGFARALLEDYGEKLDDIGRDYLDRIVRGGTRMDRLIHDVLTYTKLSRRDLQLQPVNLNKLIRDILDQYPDMQPPQAEVSVQEQLPSVTAHEPSLSQAISNLLCNAVKFVPSGENPKVKVRAERRGDRVRLWIEDNGIGIKPEHQHRIFRIFERIHPDRNYEGTGIGLAIVRRAVERMGGAVGVESDGFTGSKFWIELRTAEKPEQVGGVDKQVRGSARHEGERETLVGKSPPVVQHRVV